MKNLDFLQILAEFVEDKAIVDRMHLDLGDLIEASEWLAESIAKQNGVSSNADQLETFLINLDVHYIAHVTHHLKTLKKDVKTALRNIAKIG